MAELRALVMKLIDIFLHVDVHLQEIIQNYGTWTYFILFCIIFCETGLVVTPFLPGDSLLFAAGTFCAKGSFSTPLLIALLCVAAIVGDTVNYWIGARIGPKIFAQENVRLLNKKHLEKTHAFYERHGGKTIIIARFIPIIRTFAPFVAGIGKMSYARFLSYNVIGGCLWIVSFVMLGYVFGGLPIVKRNFSFVILGIIFVSILPGVIEYLRSRAASRAKATSGALAPSPPPKA